MRLFTELATSFWQQGRHSLAFKLFMAILVGAIASLIVAGLLMFIVTHIWIGILARDIRDHPEVDWTNPDNIEPKYATWIFLASGFIGFFIALILSAFLTIRISKPIHELTSATKNIEYGNYGYQVEVTGGIELEELGRSFNALSRSLERNEELRNNMVADIAHELRNPIATLRVQLEALEDGVLEPDKNIIDSLMEDVLLLSRLVEDLKQLTLVEAGQMEMEMMPVDVAETIKGVTSRFEQELSLKEVALELDIPPDLPLINADQIRIAQILNNLIKNSLTHTPEGGCIKVSAVRSGDEVAFSVRDTGPGMSAEELPNVFERFYRTDMSRARATGGAGLGLSIAKSLVEAHGGRIWAESAEGEGTTMSFTVPVFMGELGPEMS